MRWDWGNSHDGARLEARFRRQFSRQQSADQACARGDSDLRTDGLSILGRLGIKDVAQNSFSTMRSKLVARRTRGGIALRASVRGGRQGGARLRLEWRAFAA